MRGFWTLISGLVALPALLVILSGWYMLAVPGRSYRGPLPAPTAKERELAARLRKHVMAIAGAPHNVRNFAALEAAAQYIERELQTIGYSVGRQEYSSDGRNVRNIEAVRSPRLHAEAATLVVGAHTTTPAGTPRVPTTMRPERRRSSSWRACSRNGSPSVHACGSFSLSTRNLLTSARPTWEAGAMPNDSPTPAKGCSV